LTPQSSPFQQHTIFQRNANFLPRNDPSQEVGISETYVENDRVGALGGEPPPTNTPYQQDSSMAQPISYEEQQAIFERTLRPLLPKTTKFEIPDSFSSPYDTVGGVVTKSQPHDASNAPSKRVLQNCDQHFQIPTSPVKSHTQSALDRSWLSREEPPTQNTYIPPSPPNRWAQAREYRHRVHETPYHDIQSDPTIREVERDAEFWVSQLVHAMTNVTNVKDTNNSHAKRLFLPASYDPLLIECTSRHILTSLLDRCISGFRGPAQFNKAVRPGKDCEADLTASCEERIRNVVNALMWNKRVCKDVLYEDWKILLLVNHPKAYDKEKDCQKGSNDQRRARQVGEREKLKRTEEELLAYQRSVEQVAQQQVTDTSYFGDFASAFVNPFDVSQSWVDNQEGGQMTESQVIGEKSTPVKHAPGSKRARVEDEEESNFFNTKRQRFG
jgi:hypothetical protein